MVQAVVLVISYLIGAIPFGLIVGKVFRGIDIRDYGSGNIGATNVLRTLGKPLAILVFVCDTLKGFAAVELSTSQIPGPHQWAWVIGAALLSIAGHTASPFIKFRGGKGVATSLGVIVGMNPLIALIAFVLWVVIVAITRYVSVASLIATAAVPVMMFLSTPIFHIRVEPAYGVFSLAAALLIVIKHRSNIGRLMNGTEPKFGQKVKLEGEG